MFKYKGIDFLRFVLPKGLRNHDGLVTRKDRANLVQNYLNRGFTAVDIGRCGADFSYTSVIRLIADYNLKVPNEQERQVILKTIV